MMEFNFLKSKLVQVLILNCCLYLAKVEMDINCSRNVRVLDTIRNTSLLPLAKNTDPNLFRIYLSLISDDHEYNDYLHIVGELNHEHTSSAMDLTIKHGAIPYEYSASALNLAYEDFCASGALRDKQIEIIYMDDGCDPRHGIANIIQMHEAGVDVIIGMPCSLVTIPGGYYLSYWHIPLITYASNSAVITDIKFYDTVVRIGNGFRAIGFAFVEIFRTFNWSIVSLVTTTDGLCHYGSEYIDEEFKKANIHVAENIDIYDITASNIDQQLAQIKERARVVIVCLGERKLLEFMLSARRMDMIGPEYVYLSFSLLPTKSVLEPWGNNPQYVELFSHLKIVTVEDETQGNEQQQLMTKISNKMKEHPWSINITDKQGFSKFPYGLYLYDSMWYYLTAINELIKEGNDPKNGTAIFEKAKNRTFDGITGRVEMDQSADRIPTYWFWQMNQTDHFEHFASIIMTEEPGQMVEILVDPIWWTENNEVPLDSPRCGFLGQLCPPSNTARDVTLITVFTAVAIVLLAVVLSIYIYRKKKFEDDIQKKTWMISFQDIKFPQYHEHSKSTLSGFHGISASELRRDMSTNNQSHTKMGIYKGIKCAVKFIDKPTLLISREIMLELKQLKDLDHENLNSFVGLCVTAPNICIVTHFCAKGNLQDVLHNQEIKLDWMFKCSLISDLVNGMDHLHNSALESHGILRSTSCVIDGRWVLKITDIGLNLIKQGDGYKEGIEEYEVYGSKLWTAPELLRLYTIECPVRGTQKADIYSFAIILQEIMYRALPFFMDEIMIQPKAIINKVKLLSESPYRPTTNGINADIDPYMVDLMCECWNEEPKFRPDFSAIKRKLIVINKGKKIDIMDNMLNKLESYANNLEEIVEKRTAELSNEKKKTDTLLFRMLPHTVAEKLKVGESVPPEEYPSVTIFFSDVVGFTEISSVSSPMQVVDFLNDLYTMFDDILAKYDVYKVETIGDAYMVVSGLPKRNGHRHASEIADMALEICSSCKKFNIRHMRRRPLMIRVGMHTGPCAAGVVGLTMPRYCLFGDTVNLASRMESNGEAMKIHLSQQSYEALSMINCYVLSSRGTIHVKGKGELNTYWLDGKISE